MSISNTKKIVVFSIILFSYLVFSTLADRTLESPRQNEPVVLGKSSAKNLKTTYQNWVSDYSKDGHKGPRVGLVWNKALSSEFTSAKGIAEINIEEGKVRVKITNLADAEVSDVWLVDTQPGIGRSVQPESGDQLLHVGKLTQGNKVASLEASLDADKLKSLEVNWVVVTGKNTDPLQGGVLFGSTSLFQRIYHYKDRALLQLAAATTKSERSFRFFPSAWATGIVPADFPNAELINDGRNIFFEETFMGNGRTCGTCHPATNNFTLDPKFIATMPDDDPLFIAELPDPNPLSENFEKPKLMREVGLILENTNGFDDLESKYTMRSVPHMLAMQVSVSVPSESAYDGTTMSPDERLGWSGDGSPTNLEVFPQLRGTLRDFSVGAVTQHFTKTLNRVAGEDFRLPTEYELDALEAYILSLGRQTEYDDFNAIELWDDRAEQGRLNYLGVDVSGTLNCNACHFNGGANTNPNFDFPASVTPPAFEMSNRSFAPRSEELLDQPADIVDVANNPFDDGFGSGTNLFNAPVVIEAADTGPFFHANSADTVEAMVEFYRSKRHLRNGEVLDPIVELSESQGANIAAFLRVLNADENARSSIALIEQAEALNNFEDQQTNLEIAAADIEDAIEVLTDGDLHDDDAIPAFRVAANILRYAPFILSSAKDSLEQARGMMIQR